MITLHNDAQNQTWTQPQTPTIPVSPVQTTISTHYETLSQQASEALKKKKALLPEGHWENISAFTTDFAHVLFTEYIFTDNAFDPDIVFDPVRYVKEDSTGFYHHVIGTHVSSGRTIVIYAAVVFTHDLSISLEIKCQYNGKVVESLLYTNVDDFIVDEPTRRKIYFDKIIGDIIWKIQKIINYIDQRDTCQKDQEGLNETTKESVDNDPDIPDPVQTATHPNISPRYGRECDQGFRPVDNTGLNPSVTPFYADQANTQNHLGVWYNQNPWVNGQQSMHHTHPSPLYLHSHEIERYLKEYDRVRDYMQDTFERMLHTLIQQQRLVCHELMKAKVYIGHTRREKETPFFCVTLPVFLSLPDCSIKIEFKIWCSYMQYLGIEVSIENDQQTLQSDGKSFAELVMYLDNDFTKDLTNLIRDYKSTKAVQSE